MYCCLYRALCLARLSCLPSAILYHNTSMLILVRGLISTAWKWTITSMWGIVLSLRLIQWALPEQVSSSKPCQQYITWIYARTWRTPCPLFTGNKHYYYCCTRSNLKIWIFIFSKLSPSPLTTQIAIFHTKQQQLEDELAPSNVLAHCIVCVSLIHLQNSLPQKSFLTWFHSRTARGFTTHITSRTGPTGGFDFRLDWNNM